MNESWFNSDLNCSNNSVLFICCYRGIISSHSGLPLRRLTPEFRYHNRAVTSWPAVITAVSSNQPSKALKMPSGNKQAAGIEVTLDLCMCVSTAWAQAHCCKCVCVVCFITYKDQGVLTIIEKKWLKNTQRWVFSCCTLLAELSLVFLLTVKIKIKTGLVTDLNVGQFLVKACLMLGKCKTVKKSLEEYCAKVLRYPSFLYMSGKQKIVATLYSNLQR